MKIKILYLFSSRKESINSVLEILRENFSFQRKHYCIHIGLLKCRSYIKIIIIMSERKNLDTSKNDPRSSPAGASDHEDFNDQERKMQLLAEFQKQIEEKEKELTNIYLQELERLRELEKERDLLLFHENNENDKVNKDKDKNQLQINNNKKQRPLSIIWEEDQSESKIVEPPEDFNTPGPSGISKKLIDKEKIPNEKKQKKKSKKSKSSNDDQWEYHNEWF